MQNEIILARFKELKLEPSGIREISSLSDIDNAFPDNLLRAFEGLRFQERRETRAMIEYLKRPARDQIAFGYYQDVPSCLNAQRASGAGHRESTEKRPLNRLALPFVNVSRDVSLSFHTGGHAADEHDAGTLCDEKEQILAVCSTIPIDLSYRIWAMAADRETLIYLTSAIGAWIRLWQSRGATAFESSTTLGNLPVSVLTVLDTPKMVDWVDVSPPNDSEKLYAAELVVPVVSQLHVAHYVDASYVRWESSMGVSNGIVS